MWRFHGPDAAVIRSAVIDALAEDSTLDVVSIGLIEAQVDQATDWPKTDAELGQRLNLSAIVRGRIARAGKGRRITLTVIDAGPGTVQGKISLRARSVLALHGKVRTEGRKHLGPLIRSTTPSRAPPDKDRDEDKDKDKDKETNADPESPPARSPPNTTAAPLIAQASQNRVPSPSLAPSRDKRSSPAPRGRCDMIDFEAGGGVMLRRFDYRDEQRGALRGYALNGAPASHIEGTFYPIVEKVCRSGVAIGLGGAYDLMAPQTSHVADRPLETSAFALQAELVVRVSLGSWTLKPSAGFYARRFVVKEDVIPSVDYRAVGGAFDTTLRVDIFFVELGIGARRIVAAGELKSADWFPDAAGMGYAARARLGVAVTTWLDFGIGAQAEYVSLRLNTTDSGTYPNGVAASVYDAYFLGLAGLRAHLPGH